MKERRESAKADRRSFLKLASVGAVASGAALVTGKGTAEAAASDRFRRSLLGVGAIQEVLRVGKVLSRLWVQNFGPASAGHWLQDGWSTVMEGE